MQREANIFELKEKMHENFELIARLNEKWNTLLKFLGVQLRWKFTYLTFALFLKNEKVKTRDLSFLEEQVGSRATTGNSEIDPLLAEKYITTEHNVEEAVYFSKKSAMLMCGMDDGEMRFVRVSKSF